MLSSMMLSLILLAPALLPAPRSVEGDWPQFRGPEGTGHGQARNLPTRWSETENVVWKTEIHDRGWSSPVLYGNQIWLTTASVDGRSLYALCLDRQTGRILKDLKLFEVATPQYAHPFNSYASPTPVIEEGRVYITFGSAGTACLDTKTFQVIWQRRDIECNHFRGAGSSPILFENLLLMHFDGSDHQFAIALDKRTGKTVWQTKRSVDFRDLDEKGVPAAEGDFRKAFATPHVARIGGRWEMISLGSRAAYGYDPRTGRELWRVEEHGQFSASTRPVLGLGMIFFPTGFSTGQLFAVRTGGQGLINETHLAWKHRRSVSNKPSVLLIDDLLYMISDVGIASCLDAKTGQTVWLQRIGGEFSASPIYADGRIWLFDEEGKATVLQPGRQFLAVGENRLADGSLASPAAAGDSLYVRTRTHLYRLAQKSSGR